MFKTSQLDSEEACLKYIQASVEGIATVGSMKEEPIITWKGDGHTAVQ